MPFLNALTTYSTSTASTSATSFADSMVSSLIPDSQDNTDFFVYYHCGFGGNDASEVGEAQLLQNTGTVELGLATGEGRGNSNFFDGGQLQGFARLSNVHADQLKIRHRNVTSSDTVFTGARALVMIPLNQKIALDSFDNTIIQESAELIEDGDFYYDGTNSASAEVTGISTTETTVRTVDFANMEAGDYLIFMSCESWFSAAGSASSGPLIKFQMDASNINSSPDYVQEWEDDADRFNFAYADKVTVTAGTHTFRIRVANKTAAAIIAAGRTRIWAFRCSAFSQIAYTADTSGHSFTNTTFDDTNIMLDTAITSRIFGNPSAAVFATTNYASNGGPATGQLRQVSGSSYMDDAGEELNNSGLGSDDDLIPTVLGGLATLIMGTALTYRVRNRITAAGTGTAGKNRGNTAGVRSNLIVWELYVPRIDPIITSGGGGVVPGQR